MDLLLAVASSAIVLILPVSITLPSRDGTASHTIHAGLYRLERVIGAGQPQHYVRQRQDRLCCHLFLVPRFRPVVSRHILGEFSSD